MEAPWCLLAARRLQDHRLSVLFVTRCGRRLGLESARPSAFRAAALPAGLEPGGGDIERQRNGGKLPIDLC
jgi:hypothetical protein